MVRPTKCPFIVEFTGSPEAGKTTCIKTILKRFENQGLRVKYIQESAEIVSDDTNIPKTSFEAHLLMRLLSILSIIENKYEDYDLILVDRGLIDGIFYTIKYLTDYIDSYDECSALISLLDCLKKFITPDLLVIFRVDPETSIDRRGGEGRIVNLSFVRNYNRLLDSFVDSLTVPYNLIDTTNLSEDEVSEQVYDLITDNI